MSSARDTAAPATKSPVADIFYVPVLAVVSDRHDATGGVDVADHTHYREKGTARRRLYTTADEAKQFFNLLVDAYCAALSYLAPEDVAVGREVEALRGVLPQLEPGKRAVVARILDTAETAGAFVSSQGEYFRRDFTIAVEVQGYLVHHCPSPVYSVSGDGFAHVFKIFLKALAWNFGSAFFAINAMKGKATLNLPHIYAAFEMLTVFTGRPVPEALFGYVAGAIKTRVRAPRGAQKKKAPAAAAAAESAAAAAESAESAASAAAAAAETAAAESVAAESVAAESVAETISTVDGGAGLVKAAAADPAPVAAAIA